MRIYSVYYFNLNYSWIALLTYVVVLKLIVLNSKNPFGTKRGVIEFE